MPNFNGSSGNDIFTGGADADTLVGNGGNDSLTGGGGSDLLVGNAGSDTLNGGDGDDKLYSGDESPPFNQPYYGNPYTPPVLDTGTQVDSLVGGDGSDRIFAGYGDHVDGGAGGYSGDYLFISFLGAPTGVTVDFRQVTQTVGGGTITGIENISWIQGSNFSDDIHAGSNYNGGYSDFTAVFGMGGNDKLFAGYYTGVMFGGDGDDLVDGRGADYLMSVDGGAGNDTLYTHTNGFASADGGAGDDTIYSHAFTRGGDGNDLIILQPTYYDDWVYGDAGDDEIRASSYGSSMVGGSGADTLTGDAGKDYIYSAGVYASGSDMNRAAPPADMGLERDHLTGFGGDDILSAGYGDDVDGGSGTDTLWLSLGGLTGGTTFNTASIVNSQPFSLGGGVINSIETLAYLRGTNFADNLTVATQATLLNVDAGDGDDVITTSSSSVSALGGAGADRFVSGAAGDIFDGGSGVDTVDYSGYGQAVTVSLADRSGAGGDQLLNIEVVVGSAFADTLGGDENANTLRGGGGNDTIDGGGGTDTAEYAGVSADYRWAQGSNGFWTVTDLRAGAAEGVDTLKNIEKLQFSDRLVQISSPAPNVITGTGGADYLIATSANDIIDAGAGTDTVEYRGASTDFSVTKGSDGSWTVNDLRSGRPEGTDTLNNVEQIKFADKLLVIVSPPANEISGTGGSDNLRGTTGDDVIRGGGGDDFFYGSTGDDTYDGGSGRDLVLFHDSQQGVRVDLAIVGPQSTGEGNDTFESIETLSGSEYGDVFYGNSGANSLNGYNGNDLLDGRTGDDAIGGDSGNDTVRGGAGNDNLSGGSGNDYVYGDAGDDYIWLAPENTIYDIGSDVIDGGDGFDTLQFAVAAQGFSINLGLTDKQVIAPGLSLTVQNVERLIGGDYGDTFTGGASADILWGYGGNDSLDGGGGFDQINGNQGNDTARGGEGGDWVVGGKDNDLLYGENGVDVVNGNLGNDTCYGGADADWVRGGQGDDVLDGGAGNDWLSGDRGDDAVTGGAGADTFYFFAGAAVDRVTDFSSASGDRVLLDAGQAYTLSYTAEGAVVSLGAGDQIILMGITQATIGDWLHI